MTNNDELALKLKAASEKAGAEEWQVKRNGPGEYEVMVKGSLVKHSGWSTHRPVADEIADKKTADFIAAASPANIIALLAERDADKKRIAELNDTLERECEKSRRMVSRIAELEARTVSVKLPEVMTVYTRDYGNIEVMSAEDVITSLEKSGIKTELEE